MNEPLPEFDLYATLSVTQDAPVEVIVAAHRALIRRVHPDLHRSPMATEQARRLNLARDWLADPDRRRRYDLARRQPTMAPGGPGAVRTGSARPRADDLNARQEALDGLVDDCAALHAISGPRLDEACRIAMRDDPGLRDAIERLTAAARSARREQLALRAAADATAHLDPGLGRGEALATVIAWAALASATADLAPSDARLVIERWRACTAAYRETTGGRPSPWPSRAAERVRRAARRLRHGRRVGGRAGPSTLHSGR